MRPTRKIDYGIDAPGLLRLFFLGGLAALGVWLTSAFFLDGGSAWGQIARIVPALAAIYLTGMGCLMLCWSKFIKVKQRDAILGQIPWRGDEQVLDVGCGCGLMLVGAAHRLTTGKAIGVDIWLAKDQSSNQPDTATANARLEGVADKVEIRTADMRALPLPDQTVDVVVSNWAVHNLELEADRNQAMAEMMRVLRPRGYLILADIEHRQAYLVRLAALGFLDCRLVLSPLRDLVLRALSFGSFGPFTIYARKPFQG